MAEQSSSGENTATTEATQSKQTTRFQYPRGDAVIGEFFAANVYKSAALIDVIYLFHLDYGAGADVSQILRERLMQAARDNNSNTAVPTPPATKRTVDMPSDTESDDAVSHEAAEEDTEATKPAKKQKQQKAETQQKQTKQQSNTDEKSSDFDIAEMFD